MTRYIPRNIYTTTTTTTEVVLIDKDIVGLPQYGYSNTELIINTINIANTNSLAATINLYLKYYDEKATTAQYESTKTYTGADSRGNGGTLTTTTSNYALTDAVPDIITYYYILKNIVIPSGVTLQLDEQVFKDIDFKYYDLCIVGDSNTIADIIINFKQ